MKTSNIRGFPGYHVTKHGKVYRKGSGKYSMMGLSKEYGLKSTTTIFRLMHPDRRLTH